MAGLDVVIPAGGKLDAEFSRVVGVQSKALIPFQGRSMIGNTIEALRSSPSIGRIVVVAPQEVLDHPDAKLADATGLAVGGSPDNIMVGVNLLKGMNFPPDRILIATCDLPFLSAASIEEFLKLCSGESDFYVPLIHKDDFVERFPGAEATFAQLADGAWTTGCLYIASIRGLEVAKPHLDQVFQNRKSKLKMAMQLGLRFSWDFLMQKLTVPRVEAKIRELLKIRGIAVSGAPPELAYDLDYVEDFQYAVSAVSRAPQGQSQAEHTNS